MKSVNLGKSSSNKADLYFRIDQLCNRSETCLTEVVRVLEFQKNLIKGVRNLNKLRLLRYCNNLKYMSPGFYIA
jgi:hypothetical protein